MHINDPRMREVTLLGEDNEITAFSKWCDDQGIEHRVRRTAFNSEIRIVCNDHQFTHITLTFL